MENSFLWLYIPLPSLGFVAEDQEEGEGAERAKKKEAISNWSKFANMKKWTGLSVELSLRNVAFYTIQVRIVITYICMLHVAYNTQMRGEWRETGRILG